MSKDNKNKTKDLVAEMVAALYGISPEKMWYDIAFDAAKMLGLTEAQLSACGMALMFTHGPGHIDPEKRLELHKKIDKEIFGIES